MKRLCRVCQEEFRGRSDKRFCSDYCRAQHYNELHAGNIQLIRRVHYALRQNRNILHGLFVTFGSIEIDPRLLMDAGVRLDFVTRIIRQSNGEEICVCYDYGYSINKQGRYRLVSLPADETEGPSSTRRAAKPIN